MLADLLHSKYSKGKENAVTSLLNLSINDNNKSAIADANAIEPLIHVLENGSSEAKENSATTLFSLLVIEGNKIHIGRSGVMIRIEFQRGRRRKRTEVRRSCLAIISHIHP